jgi:hypothetical protein
MLFCAGPNEDPDHRPFGNFRQPGSVGVRNLPTGNQNRRGLPYEVKNFQEGRNKNLVLIAMEDI